jgi:hypothetical protein
MPPGPEEIETRVRALLGRLDRTLGPRLAVLGPDESIWSDFDSLRLLELLDALERELGVEIAAADARPERFDTIAKIVRYVTEHANARA